MDTLYVYPLPPSTPNTYTHTHQIVKYAIEPFIIAKIHCRRWINAIIRATSLSLCYVCMRECKLFFYLPVSPNEESMIAIEKLCDNTYARVYGETIVKLLLLNHRWVSSLMAIVRRQSLSMRPQNDNFKHTNPHTLNNTHTHTKNEEKKYVISISFCMQFFRWE